MPRGSTVLTNNLPCFDRVLIAQGPHRDPTKDCGYEWYTELFMANTMLIASSSQTKVEDK